MSDENSSPGANPESKKYFLQKLKDYSLFIAWIAVLILAGALVWTLSKPFLTSQLLHSINQSIAANNETFKSKNKTKTTYPKTPYNIDGIPESVSVANSIIFINFLFFAYSFR